MARVSNTVAVLVFGDKQAALKFKRGAKAAANMTPALELITDDMFRVIGATFTGQGRRFGGSWTHLDPATLQRKAAKGQDSRILIATRDLMNAMSVRGAAHQHLVVTPHAIELDTDLDYAGPQQYGVAGHLPARPFIDFYPADRARWAQTCLDYLMGAMAG